MQNSRKNGLLWKVQYFVFLLTHWVQIKFLDQWVLFQSVVACLYSAPFNQLLQLPPGHTSGNLIYISHFTVVERISTLSSKRKGSSIWVAHSIKFSSLLRGRNCSQQASRDPALSPQDDKLTTQYAPLRGVAPSISRTWIGGYFDYRPGLWFYH